MGKLLDFLINNDIETEVKTEVEIAPFPFPFVVKSITEAENKMIRKSCEKSTFNKKTHQKETERDTDLYMNKLVVACTLDPNFKDAELQKKFGVVGAEDLVGKLLNVGQHAKLVEAIQSVNGFDNDINELIDEAKN